MSIELKKDRERLELEIVEDYVVLLQKHRLTKRECEKILERAYTLMGPRTWLPKVFKVFRVSENTNEFCLYGMWLMARDGECWEVARSQRWPMGAEIQVLVDPDSGEPDWSALSCEIPTRKVVPGLKGEPGATPAQVIAEVWK